MVYYSDVVYHNITTIIIIIIIIIDEMYKHYKLYKFSKLTFQVQRNKSNSPLRTSARYRFDNLFNIRLRFINVTITNIHTQAVYFKYLYILLSYVCVCV